MNTCRFTQMLVLVMLLAAWFVLVPLTAEATPPVLPDSKRAGEHIFAESLPSVPHSVQASEVAVQADNVFTWTQDTRANWEHGTLEMLDSVAISGSLQLAQRYFSESTTVTPREELGAGQDHSDIAVDASGNAYAIWSDWREDNADIYFAYRPAGGTWGSNVKINDDTGAANQYYPAIAVDDAGNAYAVWQDYRNGDPDIYFAYRQTGETWGANVRINDDLGTTNQSTPAIVVDNSNNIYVVWTDYRNGRDWSNADIYFAHRPAQGTWSPSMRVNDDMSRTDQSNPAIAVDANGIIYVVWEDGRNGNMDIYFAEGVQGGDWSINVKINDDIGVKAQYAPAVTVDNNRNVYVVWNDYRNTSGWTTDIYFAYRSQSDGEWGLNIKINDDSTYWRADPDIALDSLNNAYAIWQVWGGYSGIYFSSFAGGVWNSNSAVYGYPGVPWQIHPALAVDDSGGLYVLGIEYVGWYHGHTEASFTYRPSGGNWVPLTRINDDIWTSQSSPAIAADSSGIYAVWSDGRNFEHNIYFAHRLSESVIVWSDDVQINDVAGGYSPDIATDSKGNVHVIWDDSRGIYSAYRPSGGVWSTNAQVNDTASTYQLSPSIAVDEANNAYAVWSDDRDGNDDIYFAYRPNGGIWGVNIKVNDDSGTAEQSYPAIVLDNDGNAYAAWLDQRDGSNDIYFAYRPTGGVWSVNIRVNDTPGSASNYAGPEIAVDTNGTVYVVWQDQRTGQNGIYIASRTVDGIWSTNNRVDNVTGMLSQNSPALAISPSDNVYVAWSAYYNGNHIHFAYKDADGTWSSSVVVDDGLDKKDRLWPAITVDDSENIYVTWTDARYGDHHIRFAQSLPKPQYLEQGVYTSPILDADVVAVVWESLTYSATLPAGTTLVFEARSQTAGSVWSAWQPVSNNAIASMPGQYFQYRVTFSTTITDATPMLDWVKVRYTSATTPSAPRFATPCGVTNQVTPTLKGAATAGSVVHLYVNGTEVLTTTTNGNGMFTIQPALSTGSYVVTTTASNAQGVGPASTPLALTVAPALPYDPLNVRAGQWSKDGWLLSPPRDAQGCANPDDWQVWPRWNEKFMVQVPVSFTMSAAVTVTVGTQTITLTEGTGKVFAGVFQPLLTAGTFVIVVNADGHTTTVNGRPVLIDPDGFVYEASGTISDTIPGVQVTCYYSDTHSGQWLMWDAWNYDNQINPQTTLDDGYYSFYTPSGRYRVVAEKDGYPIYVSPDLVVVSTPVRYNIPLGYPPPMIDYDLYLPLVLRSHSTLSSK